MTHRKLYHHLALGSAIFVLSACATSGQKTSLDPTTAAISEVYVEDFGNDTRDSDDAIVTTGARSRASSRPAPAPIVIRAPVVEALPAPSAEYADEDILASSPSASIVRPSPSSPPTDGGSYSNPQAGLLTAGDYDDVLNPDLYQAYLEKKLQGALGNKSLPYVDADQRITIRVLDRLGKPMPQADISLRYSDGEKMFPLRTGADGLAYIYPNFDALKPETVIKVSAKNAKSVEKILPGGLIHVGGSITVDLNTDRKRLNNLDLLLTIDATGSMADEMRYLQTELQAILNRVEARNPGVSIRTGLIVYRDKGDDYVVKTIPFTDDIDDFKRALSNQNANGGGDRPEAMHVAMRTGLKMDWRKNAVKVNLLVADAPPHDEDISDTWKAGLISRTRGIHVVPIAASGIDPTAEFLMRSMAQITGGRYLFLTDDSGIGNPHAKPTVDCYVVTRLDGLVTRVLNSLMTGERDEPEAADIIRTVGNYRSGVCAISDAAAGAMLKNVSQ